MVVVSAVQPNEGEVKDMLSGPTIPDKGPSGELSDGTVICDYSGCPIKGEIFYYEGRPVDEDSFNSLDGD